MKKLIIGIDFDGTCVAHDFPRIGREIGAVPVLKALTLVGHRLILFTMRSDKSDVKTDDPNIDPNAGKYLTEAVAWFKKHDIPLWGINENPEQKSWSDSPKPYCHLYIDDAALGCPLIMPNGNSSDERPFVYWPAIVTLLKERNALPLDGTCFLYP